MTVKYDLAIAVVVGVIVSALVYARNNARHIHAKSRLEDTGARVYNVNRPFFFGSAEGFAKLFDINRDPQTVTADFARNRLVDQSAVQALEGLAGRYRAVGKVLQLRHLSRDCHRFVAKAGHLMIDSNDDPEYMVAVEYNMRSGALGAGHYPQTGATGERQGGA